MPLYTEKEMQEQQSVVIGAVGIAFFLAIALVNAPGMVILATMKDLLDLDLDTGQMWTFSIITSLLIFGAIRTTSEEWSNALLIYVIACISIAVFFALSHFGFKALFPERYLSFFL
ncbi:hypothetical protein NR756_04870 [Alloalcanivorax xenomutans]|jgi:uncharacterized membrane protein|uniref:hypothetical protein n=1 Tax=Alloalcanivorax xenomutans TaxID=1094342 RepID=UPI000E2287DD